MGHGDKVYPEASWIYSTRTCLGCFCGQWGSSRWWVAGWPRSPSALLHSAYGTQALPGRERRNKMFIVCEEFTAKCFVLLHIPLLTVSSRLMAWPLLGLPKPAAGDFSSATFSFFQRFPPSRASAWQQEIRRSQRQVEGSKQFSLSLEFHYKLWKGL